MKFALVFADSQKEWNTSEFRVAIPGRALARAGHGVSLIPVQLFQEGTKESEEVCANADIICIERNLIGDSLTKMAFWFARGKIIVCNFDDNYELIEPSNVSYPYWHDGAVRINQNGEEKVFQIFPHPLKQFEVGTKISYAIVTPSKHLCEYYSKYAPAYFLPNYFEIENYINQKKPEQKDIIIGWGGSLSHLPSFTKSGVLDALRNVCENRSDVKIKICGDNRVYDEVRVPDEQKIFQPYVPHSEWPKIINTFSIGLAPLAGPYDEYRSWIKPVEFCLTETPWIGSYGPAYKELGQYGNLVDNSVESWSSALFTMIDNLEYEKERMKGEPHQFGLSLDVNKNVDNIVNIYKEIARTHARVEFS